MANNTPEVRFEGFSGEWEESTLGDISEIKTGPFGSTLHAKDYVNDGIPIITTEHFKSGNLVTDKNGLPQVSDEDYIRLKSYLLVENDIVFSRVGSVDINALILKQHSGWLFSGRVLRVRTLQNIDSQYLHYELSTTRVKNNIISRAVGQTMPSINTEILKLTPVFFSKNLEEQTKISSFFKQLDDSIALQQQELDSLKQTKQGFLQKMFPKEGETVPEVRFPGFSGAWKPQRIIDIANRFDNLRVPITASDRIAGSTPYYGANGIQGYIKGYTHKGEYILIAEDGANDLKNYPVQYVSGEIWVNNHAHVLQAKKDIAENKFLMNAIRNTNIEPFLVGGGRAKLNADVMMKIILKIPSIEEQAQIGTFFKQLDDTIALHQQELGAMKETKKAFLQKMFV